MSDQDFMPDFDSLNGNDNKENNTPSLFYENVDNNEDHFQQLSKDMAGVHAARFNSLLMEMKDSDFIKYYGMLLEYTRPKLQRVAADPIDDDQDFVLKVEVISNKPEDIINYNENPDEEDEDIEDDYNLEDND